MYPPETQAKIALFRAKMAEGTMTIEEMKEAVELLREGRLAASLASASSTRKRAAREIPKADDLLGELEGRR